MPGRGETVTGLDAAALIAAAGRDRCRRPAVEATPPHAHSTIAIARSGCRARQSPCVACHRSSLFACPLALPIVTIAEDRPSVSGPVHITHPT